MLRRNAMSRSPSRRASAPHAGQSGAVLIGLAGGMMLVSGGLAGAFYLGLGRGAHAATGPRDQGSLVEARGAAAVPPVVAGYVQRTIDVVASGTTVRLRWAELGIEGDPDEAGRAGALAKDADLAALAARGSIPVRLDRDKAVKALLALKAKVDRSPTDAFLDLEERTIHADTPGQGIDVWGSLPRLELAARQGATKVELIAVAVPAAVTKAGIGIDDISHVMGTHITRFSIGDRDRVFNLKLAASKLNGVVLQPGVEFSFNGTVGERSEKEGYKIAHVINAGEMVDGLAGGTCQISTTLFGASFFAGLDIVKTTNHSRPSVYTPLGFDATVVWPDTDLKLKNPYDFPVVIHYRVTNGEAFVEILGKARPWDKIVFERDVLEETPFTSEERLDEVIADGATSLDQAGFNGYKLKRTRRFYKDGKDVKNDTWIVTYKPVTEYIRRGTNKDPEAKIPEPKELHGPKAPDDPHFAMAQ
jgi:vancomycin resistance protein YoaR